MHQLIDLLRFSRRHACSSIRFAILAGLCCAPLARTISASEEPQQSVRAAKQGVIADGRILISTTCDPKVAKSVLDDPELGIGVIRAFTLVPTEYENWPDRWLPCDGRELNITEFADLAKQLGVGSDGASTFRVPDYSGMICIYPMGDCDSVLVPGVWHSRAPVEEDEVKRGRCREVRWYIRARN